ncbi:MAG: bifunctional rhamnulose-1-phosphate aldolase/short-chain dehydrogenase [Saprospiraceae bacterium]
MPQNKFLFVHDLWDDRDVSNFSENEVELFLYRSNKLGSDLRITNYGGGNTSCKTIERDPLTGEDKEVMWIKGSGGDIGTLTIKGTAALYTDKLHSLKKLYKGLEFEDDMVDMLHYCFYNLSSAPPSIDTPLHGFLPFKHIDHLHPDAIISIAAAEDGEAITKELFEGKIGWIGWQRPGFDLGLQLEAYVRQHPNMVGLILKNHGLFTWGDTSKECYYNSLNVIESASLYIASKTGKNKPVFGGELKPSLHPEERKILAARLMPTFRGICSSNQMMVGHFTDDPKVLEFVNSRELIHLAPLGTSCPDHFLRTKIKPLVIDIPIHIDINDSEKTHDFLLHLFEQYRLEYSQYYDTFKTDSSPTMRDANPVILLVPSIGMFSFAKNKQTARVASEYYINAINVMRGAEAISKYTSLAQKEAFNIEYWLLEEAKLQRLPKEKKLSRKIAVVSGAAGGIGNAIAKKLISEGAYVAFLDKSDKVAEDVCATFSQDIAIGITCDITKKEEIEQAFQKVILAFGGVDILVHSAGLAISKPLGETTLDDWNILQDVLVKGQYLLSQSCATIMKKQRTGGDIISIASKNGIVAGPNNIAYGTAKAAQQHMVRLLAAELSENGIRVNTVNPDGVIVGSKIWEGAWAEGRAKAYNIDVAQLPEYYAQRNLLKEIILPEDIADGVFSLLLLRKSTGNSINVDGGLSAAFLR